MINHKLLFCFLIFSIPLVSSQLEIGKASSNLNGVDIILPVQEFDNNTAFVNSSEFWVTTDLGAINAVSQIGSDDITDDGTWITVEVDPLWSGNLSLVAFRGEAETIGGQWTFSNVQTFNGNIFMDDATTIGLDGGCEITFNDQATDNIIINSNGANCNVGIGTDAQVDPPEELFEVGDGNMMLHSLGGAAAEPITGIYKTGNAFDNTGDASANKLLLFDSPGFRSGWGVSTGDTDMFSGGDWNFYTNSGTLQGTIGLIIQDSVANVIIPNGQLLVDQDNEGLILGEDINTHEYYNGTDLIFENLAVDGGEEIYFISWNGYNFDNNLIIDGNLTVTGDIFVSGDINVTTIHFGLGGNITSNGTCVRTTSPAGSTIEDVCDV